jgi:hypothetical protein
VAFMLRPCLLENISKLKPFPNHLALPGEC